MMMIDVGKYIQLFHLNVYIINLLRMGPNFTLTSSFYWSSHEKHHDGVEVDPSPTRMNNIEN